MENQLIKDKIFEVEVLFNDFTKRKFFMKESQIDEFSKILIGMYDYEYAAIIDNPFSLTYPITEIKYRPACRWGMDDEFEYQYIPISNIPKEPKHV